jgi:N-acetylmuramoyl-L-alanine amidase
MRIENHWLTQPPDGIALQRTAGKVGEVIEPRIIVLHYGVTDSLDALVSAQRSSSYWAHLSIDGWFTGKHSVVKATQAIPFNRRGTHAGLSHWNGVEGVNGCSIGIEISNPGPLVRGADGKLRTVYGKEWPESDALEAKHKSGVAPKNWTHWAQYSDEELDLLVHLCALLIQTYPTLEAIVGHDDVSTGRKFDPGPALPVEHISKHAFAFGRRRERP